MKLLALATCASGLKVATQNPVHNDIESMAPNLHHILNFSKDPNALIHAGKATIEQELENLKFLQKGRTDKHLEEAGLSRETVARSPEKNQEDWHKSMSELHNKAEVKEKHMSPSEALEALGTRFSAADKEHLSNLMNTAGKQEPEPKNKKQLKEAVGAKGDVTGAFMRAMNALNNMYYKVDAERIQKLTSCQVTLHAMYVQQWKMWETVSTIEGEIGEAYEDLSATFIKYYNEYMAGLDITQEKARNQMQHQEVLDGKNSYLRQTQADLIIWKFIYKKAMDRCGTKSSGSTTFAQMDDSKKAQCARTCDKRNNDPVARNAVLLSVFSDPEIVRESKRVLDIGSQKHFDNIHRSLKEAAEEKVAPKYLSFLQKTSSPGGSDAIPPPWMITDQACNCPSLAHMQCHEISSLVGGEVECKKAEESRARSARDTAATEKQEDDDYYVAKLSYNEKSRKERFLQIIMRFTEIMKLSKRRIDEANAATQFAKETSSEKFKCFLELSELESNGFCSVKNIRNYFKKLTMRTLRIKKRDVTDCQMEKYLFASGSCQLDGREVTCLEPLRKNGVPLKGLAAYPDEKPSQVWHRFNPVQDDPDEKYKLSEKLGVNTANITLALECDKMQGDMVLPCNNFLCPIHCQTTEFPQDFSDCTAACDGGFKSRQREVIVYPENGGDACPETREEKQCNTEVPCDKDCVLHDNPRVLPCTKACRGENDAEPPAYLQRYDVKSDAVGKGICGGFNHDGTSAPYHIKRVEELECGDVPRCQDDMICTEQMDLVIVMECSQQVSRIGCYMMSAFTMALMDRLKARAWGSNAINVALIKYGNGYTYTKKDLAGKTLWKVTPPQQVVADWSDENAYGNMTDDVQGVQGYLSGGANALMRLQDASSSENGGATASIGQEYVGGNYWYLGFNNLQMALSMAQNIFQSSSRAGDGHTLQKVLILTRGKKIDCTTAQETAKGLKESMDVMIDVVLFAPDATAENVMTTYEDATKLSSYPHHRHTQLAGSLHLFIEEAHRQKVVNQLVPSVCQRAISKSESLETMCEKNVILLHTGKVCANWNVPLSDYPVPNVEECASLASKANLKGFVYIPEAPVESYQSGEQSVNCMYSNSTASEPQYSEQTFLPVDSTCDYVHEWEEEGAAGLGWFKSDDGEAHHYALVSGGNCPSVHDHEYVNAIWPLENNDAAYFGLKAESEGSAPPEGSVGSESA